MPRRNYSHNSHNHQNSNNYQKHEAKKSSSEGSSSLIANKLPREIPGYYYDEERDKYFKISPNSNFGQEAMVNSLKSISTIQGTSSQNHDITDFQIHKYRNTIYLGNLGGTVGQIKFQCSSESCHELSRTYIAMLTSEITSINLFDKNFLIYTSLGNDLSPGVLHVGGIIPLSDDDESIIELTPNVIYNSKSTIWTSTYSELDKSIALGTSKKVVVLQGLDMPIYRLSQFKTGSDVFSVDFDKNRPSILYAGCRDGQLRIFDIRSSYRKNTLYGEGPVIKQSSPICHLKQIGSWYIITDGMDGSLSLWDIRKDQNGNNSNTRSPSRSPVMEFKGNVNSNNIRMGFAVNSNETIVSVAGQDKRVRFYSLSTGNAIRSPIGPFEDKVNAIRFCDYYQNIYLSGFADSDEDGVNDKSGERGEGLWIAVNNKLHWWSRQALPTFSLHEPSNYSSGLISEEEEDDDIDNNKEEAFKSPLSFRQRILPGHLLSLYPFYNNRHIIAKSAMYLERCQQIIPYTSNFNYLI
ncbi:7245_t:CDS:2 [Entrophospora sp. SA101]|nr:1336_t:CDS:2 [Entrophospora sp. SA101]CAJ0831586.1 13146_t:CDS:2 [Entrophospora sp. SA101]CAJ0840080.1 7245_t:CDS:2 [Entrophospora sp. SA101]